MASLTHALQELREQRKQAQSQIEKLDQAISVIESLNGSGTSRTTTQPKRIISAASRRKMALAQKARWAKIRKGPKPVAAAAKPSASASVKRTISAAGRKRIAAFQRARWARIRAGRTHKS
jgi:TolA-binding protein